MDPGKRQGNGGKGGGAGGGTGGGGRANTWRKEGKTGAKWGTNGGDGGGGKGGNAGKTGRKWGGNAGKWGKLGGKWGGNGGGGGETGPGRSWCRAGCTIKICAGATPALQKGYLMPPPTPRPFGFVGVAQDTKGQGSQHVDAKAAKEDLGTTVDPGKEVVVGHVGKRGASPPSPRGAHAGRGSCDQAPAALGPLPHRPSRSRRRAKAKGGATGEGKHSTVRVSAFGQGFPEGTGFVFF